MIIIIPDSFYNDNMMRGQLTVLLTTKKNVKVRNEVGAARPSASHDISHY
jgi:hypothetical protein